MCEQPENNYLDGDVVWVKLGSCWWPGEVVSPEKLPPDVLPSFRKPPIAVVKFFQEDTYEYVKNTNSIYKYNCSRKNEFINKGLYMYRTKHGPMEKFPEDVIRAETAVGGDIKILTRDEFQEEKKESYAGLFGEPAKKTPVSGKKGKGGKGKSADSPEITTPIRKMKEKTNYKVHILVQGSKTTLNQSTDAATTASTSRAGSESAEEKTENTQSATTAISVSTPTISMSGVYSCHACSFTTTRLNVLIMHNKTHSVTFTPYTPSPVTKKITKLKNTSTSSKTPKIRKPKQEKKEEVNKNAHAQKRLSQEKPVEHLIKKVKTDEEIKSSLLADWDDVDEESNDVSTMTMAGSPEVPVGAESPAVPTPAELPSAQIPGEMSSLPLHKKSEETPPADKPESSSDSKYEFCEDEDWSLEADAGRKIPRVKNPSKRKEDLKSLSIDDDDVAKEVTELLNKTVVPELPSIPEPLKVEENFPELSIAKSPDKRNDPNLNAKSSEINNSLEKKDVTEQPPKTIFKTKTFFRSRHSRSQDAIGKYVAEQLNAAERMDISESEINGTDVASSPEARESPPVEQIKVARLAPKIQLKRMKAEAAQQREKERYILEQNKESTSNGTVSTTGVVAIISNDFSAENNYTNELLTDRPMHSANSIMKVNKIRNDTSELDDIPEIKKILGTTLYCTTSISKSDKRDESMSKNLREEIITEVMNTDKDTVCTEGEGNGIDSVMSDFRNKKENELQITPKPSVESQATETTATAVDALLSVSREADSVTKVISDDPPEDLFEDDIRDNTIVSNVNGYNEINKEGKNKNEDLFQENIHEHKNMKTESIVEQNINSDNVTNVAKNVENKDKSIMKYEQQNNIAQIVADNAPTESDLQIAEALINLPSTAIQNKAFTQQQDTIPTIEIKPLTKTPENEMFVDENVKSDNIKDLTIKESVVDSNILANNDNIARYETEQEKSENLNAAQSLVQMSESIDHKINFVEINSENKGEVDLNINELKKGDISEITVEQKLALLSNESNIEQSNGKTVPYETTSSKLLKILEEPTAAKVLSNKTIVSKQVIMPGKEKILNFDVCNQSMRGKSQSPKQKIIIRRTTSNKNLLNNVNEVSSVDKIILSRSNKPVQDGSSVQTYTIQTSPEAPSDANTIIIQQKIRKMSKPSPKIPKIKPSTSLVAHVKEAKAITEIATNEEQVFDINSMPVVLSDDILTPESIEKMPIVMTDGSIITNSTIPPKLVKTKSNVVESEICKVTVNPVTTKAEIKTILMNPCNESSKVTTPNILSKSSKLRGAKPMLVIDKATGKQKIIMSKPEPVVKEVKQPTTTLIQTVPQGGGKAEKFIILPTPTSPRPNRTQKIVIDPQTGKAHVLVGKGPEMTLGVSENKTVSAKLIPQSSDNNTPGNTVMIITNSQGGQSKIILTPEHEKILFPNKTNVSQLKSVTHRITTNSVIQQKTVVSTVTSALKGQTRIVPKQKNTIITSKGQLIVGGRVTTTTQNIAPMPEIRPALKRIVPAEPKKIIQTIQKDAPEPIIFFQRKSGAVMQLTQAQFEHLQRTGQLIHKTGPAHENKIVIQKSITIPASEPLAINTPKQRARKGAVDSQTPMKKAKQEVPIAPAPGPASPMPALTSLSHTISATLQTVPSTTSVASASNYPDLENFEELLPSTAIARQPESVLIQPEQPIAPPQAAISDGQLLAVPGEHFGGLPGSFYLCVEDNGNYTIVDNRPLMLENNQLVPMAEPVPVIAPQPERRDILEAALANSDVFHAETVRDEAPDFRDLNANVSVHCRVSETSTTLNQPIMTPVEVPTKADAEPAVPSNLEDGLAVIGVTPQTVPTSLELPITVTDPRIAPKTTNPLTINNYGTSLLPSPNTDMTFVSTEEVEVPVGGPISMPLLTDEESVGKSMPILTDDVTERTVSSIESTAGSPSSVDVRESETEDSSQWSQRLLTPGSDTSETSSEIPLQPVIKLSVNDLSHSD
ncbi:unnamed protein product [Parnassius apollo]|uniref:(apollo) hypothetical protein n=1 Tax=Parnassius apollo TaxID=110799 RepID=A0A8S3W6B5_PARAO|nr:unnamed protein product [Parnassius apollo]